MKQIFFISVIALFLLASCSKDELTIYESPIAQARRVFSNPRVETLYNGIVQYSFEIDLKFMPQAAPIYRTVIDSAWIMESYIQTKAGYYLVVCDYNQTNRSPKIKASLTAPLSNVEEEKFPASVFGVSDTAAFYQNKKGLLLKMRLKKPEK